MSIKQELSPEYMFQQILSRIDDLNSKFMSIIEAQNETIRGITEKLVALSDISILVGKHSDKLSYLENTCKLLARDIETLRESTSSAGGSDTPAEITLSGIPLDLVHTPAKITEKVFHALGVPQLSSEVLDIRRVVMSSSSTDNARTRFTGSFIVKLKSSRTRDHIIKMKLSKKILSASEVFKSGKEGNVYVNEFLPRSVYELFRKAKVRVLSGTCKYVWSKSGEIFARKDDRVTVIKLSSETDLIKLDC